MQGRLVDLAGVEFLRLFPGEGEREQVNFAENGKWPTNPGRRGRTVDGVGRLVRRAAADQEQSARGSRWRGVGVPSERRVGKIKILVSGRAAPLPVGE